MPNALLLNLFQELATKNAQKEEQELSFIIREGKKRQNEVQPVPSGGVGLGWQMGTHAGAQPSGVEEGCSGAGTRLFQQPSANSRWEVEVQEKPCLLCPALHPW